MGTYPAPRDPRRRPVVRWQPPADTPWATTPPQRPTAADHPRARLIVSLTLACTILALYDLYLLAAGF